MNFLKGNWIFLLVCLCCTGCGYRHGHGRIESNYRSVAIPYIEGDRRGFMTNAIIRTLASRSHLLYTQSGELCLCVCLEEPQDENIGFRYAPEDNGNLSNIVVSTEARLTLTARVSVTDRSTGCCILGPCKISSCIDYDFEPDLTDLQAHKLSLGQLEMHNEAENAAYLPLYDLLAEKIVDYLLHGC